MLPRHFFLRREVVLGIDHLVVFLFHQWIPFWNKCKLCSKWHWRRCTWSVILWISWVPTLSLRYEWKEMFCVVSEDDRLNCGVVKVKCDNEWNVIGTFLLRDIYSCSWLWTVWWFRVCGQRVTYSLFSKWPPCTAHRSAVFFTLANLLIIIAIIISFFSRLNAKLF